MRKKTTLSTFSVEMRNLIALSPVRSPKSMYAGTLVYGLSLSKVFVTVIRIVQVLQWTVCPQPPGNCEYLQLNTSPPRRPYISPKSFEANCRPRAFAVTMRTSWSTTKTGAGNESKKSASGSPLPATNFGKQLGQTPWLMRSTSFPGSSIDPKYALQ